VQVALTQAHRGIGNHAEIAAQVVRRLAPQVGSLLLQFANFLERGFQILQLPRGFLLLQLEELRDALLDAGAAQRGPQPIGLAGGLRIDAAVALQFLDHDFVELAKLAGDFPQVIALLPTLQTVGRRLRLTHLADPLERVPLRTAQLALERRQQPRDVIVQIGVGQRFAGGQGGIPIDGTSPGMQDGCAPTLQVVGQRDKLAIDTSHGFLSRFFLACRKCTAARRGQRRTGRSM